MQSYMYAKLTFPSPPSSSSLLPCVHSLPPLPQSSPLPSPPLRLLPPSLPSLPLIFFYIIPPILFLLSSPLLSSRHTTPTKDFSFLSSFLFSSFFPFLSNRNKQGMGRVKLKIKKLENTNGRQATYAKRKHGIMKKANELSILCDIDIILLMFSPTGKPSICKGTRSIEEVISKFAQLTPQERAKRKLESLEALKKTFKKLDHDVNIPEFLGTSSPTIEDLTNQARVLQHQLSELHKRLSFWTDPDKINSIEHLRQLENSLKESLNRIQAHKESIGRQQLIAIECNNQFQNGMHVPFRMGAEQQVPHMSWVPNNDSQHIVLPEDSNLLSHRDVECCGSSSFGSYSGYFGMGKTSELANSGQDSSLSSLLSELSGTASMRQPLAGNYSCLPYNLNLLNDVKFQSAVEMNLQKSPVEFHATGSYGAPKPDHDSTTGSWASTSGTCGVSIFDEHLYSQQPN